MGKIGAHWMHAFSKHSSACMHGCVPKLRSVHNCVVNRRARMHVCVCDRGACVCPCIFDSRA
jgi:hypothetical protein